MKMKFLIMMLFLCILAGCDIIKDSLISPAEYIFTRDVSCTVSDNRIWSGEPDAEDPDSENNIYINSSITLIGLPAGFIDEAPFTNPLGYIGFLFPNHDYNSIISGSYESRELWLSGPEGTPVNVSMTYTATSTSQYSLSEPALRGINDNETTTALNGELKILDFEITSNDGFVSGTAVCVFSGSYPGGLLYICYKHSSGLVSLIYANTVEPVNFEETGNYFPDGSYNYVWSVYKP